MGWEIGQMGFHTFVSILFWTAAKLRRFFKNTPKRPGTGMYFSGIKFCGKSDDLYVCKK